jgi:hypothetical protein
MNWNGFAYHLRRYCYGGADKIHANNIGRAAMRVKFLMQELSSTKQACYPLEWDAEESLSNYGRL